MLASGPCSRAARPNSRDEMLVLVTRGGVARQGHNHACFGVTGVSLKPQSRVLSPERIA